MQAYKVLFILKNLIVTYASLLYLNICTVTFFPNPTFVFIRKNIFIEYRSN